MQSLGEQRARTDGSRIEKRRIVSHARWENPKIANSLHPGMARTYPFPRFKRLRPFPSASSSTYLAPTLPLLQLNPSHSPYSTSHPHLALHTHHSPHPSAPSFPSLQFVKPPPFPSRTSKAPTPAAAPHTPHLRLVPHLHLHLVTWHSPCSPANPCNTLPFCIPTLSAIALHPFFPTTSARQPPHPPTPYLSSVRRRHAPR